MKDFLGNEVGVGDYIFYTTSQIAESRIGQVTRFTEKSMFVRVIKNNRPGGDVSRIGEVVVRNDFVRVDYNA